MRGGGEGERGRGGEGEEGVGEKGESVVRLIHVRSCRSIGSASVCGRPPTSNMWASLVELLFVNRHPPVVDVSCE